MPLWFIDPPTSLYLLVGIVIVILGALWFREPSRPALLRFGITTIVLGLFVLIGWLIDSPREEAVWRMNSMAKATVSRDLDGVFSHVSDSFRYKNSIDKAEIRQYAQRAESLPEWNGVDVWDFDRNEVQYVDSNTIKIGFLVQARGMPQGIFWCLATFSKDRSSGKYLLSGFSFYNPLQKDKSPEEVIPGLG